MSVTEEEPAAESDWIFQEGRMTQCPVPGGGLSPSTVPTWR